MTNHALRGRGAVAGSVTFVAFALMNLQVRLNGALASDGAHPINVAMINMAIQLTCVAALVLTVPGIRRGALRFAHEVRRGAVPPWQFVGGLVGAVMITAMGVVSPLVGVAVFAVCVVAGQTTSSLIVDRLGLGPAGRRPVTGPRVFAAGIAVAAVVVSVSDRLGSADFTTAAIAAIGLAVVGGVGVAFQAAANGRIAQTSGQPVVGAGVNFLVGVTILAIAVVTVTGPTRDGFLGDTPSPAWLYVGALFGLLVVIVSAWAVKYLGILVFSLIGVSGQLCGSVVIDLVSPTGAFTVTWALVAGSVLTLVAVVIGSGWRPWRGREPQPPLSGGG